MKQREATGWWLLGTEDAGFLRGDQFVADTAPTNLAREQRADEIHKIEKGDEDADGDVNPGLRIDLGFVRGE